MKGKTIKRTKSPCRATLAILTVVILFVVKTFAAAGEVAAQALKPPFSVSEKPLVTAEDAADVPTFQLRARVTSCQGRKPENETFTFCLAAFSNPCGTRATVTGGAWTDWLNYDRKVLEMATIRHAFSHNYPVELDIRPMTMDLPAVIEIEAREKEGAPVRAYTVDCCSVGVALRVAFYTWRDKENQPHFMLRREFNQPFWDWCKTIAIPENERPKLFPIIVQGSGYHNDSDRFVGLPYMVGVGITMPWFPNPIPPREDMLRASGLHRIFGRCFRPPFDFSSGGEPYHYYQAAPLLGKRVWGFEVGKWAFEDADKWASETIAPYLEMGFKPEEIAMRPEYNQSVWSYPAMFKSLSENPAALQRFRDYIKDQGLTPQDVGAASWDQVLPLGRGKAMELPSRRLFYWTTRFFSWDSARHLANTTRALEKAARPNMPIIANLGTVLGANRLYSLRPTSNKAAKTDPVEGAGAYSSGALDDNADKTSPDAAQGTYDWLEFGRMRGSTLLWGTSDPFVSAQLRCAAEKGGVQFGGCILGEGKGDCHDHILRNILSLVGGGGKGLAYDIYFGPNEHATYNSYRMNPSMLTGMAEAHRMIGKAEDLLWPGKPPRAQVAILAPRSAELWDKETTVGYMHEESNIYRALQQANVPVDFVEEDDLSPKGLEPYKVLYVTEPNIPAEFQKGLLAWVQGGGALAMSRGAGAFDRYNDPCDILHNGSVDAGKGRVAQFTWTPGAFSETIRSAMLSPVQEAKVVLPVTADRVMVETPMLLSEKGAAVTLLNWTGETQKEVQITARVPFRVKSVESVKRGKLTFTQMEQGVICALPLGAADIVLLRP